MDYKESVEKLSSMEVFQDFKTIHLESQSEYCALLGEHFAQIFTYLVPIFQILILQLILLLACVDDKSELSFGASKIFSVYLGAI